MPRPLFLPYLAAGLLACLLLPAPAWSQVSGTVLDSATMQPIGAALIRQQATKIRTNTYADGTFDLTRAVGSNLVIAAAKKGYYNGHAVVSSPATGVQILLTKVPAYDDPTYDLLPPQACDQCHPDQVAEWTGSAMSHAGVNTWLYDIYDGQGTPGGMGGFVYQRDSVHAATNPASECALCHQPVPWIKTKDLNQGLDDITSLSQGAREGVSCDVCHKIADITKAKINFPGLHPEAVLFSKPPPGPAHQVEYGAYGDAIFFDPVMKPSYQPELVAGVCGSCHQDKNDPDGNGNFEEPNGVISEPTYQEWLLSSYADPTSPNAATCVDCHMQPNGETRVSILPEAPERERWTVHGHDIEGTTPRYLQNAASLAIRAQQTGSLLSVEVDVTNDQTGHHVPTGVTVRNMILLVEAWRDSDGQQLPFTGTQTVDDLGGIGDPNDGYFAGLAGKLFAKVNHDATGAGPVFFTEATGILWDNRIPAEATDTTQYSFDVPPGSGSLTVRARLVYRRAFRFLVDAKGWTEDGHGAPLEDVRPPYFGYFMEEAFWPSVPFRMTVGTLTAGIQNSISTSGARPGDEIFLCFSLQGDGPTHTQYGFSVDLSPPIEVRGPVLADPSGAATFTSNVPGSFAGRTLWIQAINRRNTMTFEISNMELRVVQ